MNMTWATFYLICFVTGFTFSALSLLGGIGKLHFPGRGHWFHLGHAGTHAAGGMGRGGGAGGRTMAQGPLSPAHLPFFSFFSTMAFLTWFGGTGYLLTEYSSFWFLLALGLATVSGLAGAGVIFWFLARVLLAHEKQLDPADFELVGVLGRISIPIREGGTGEIIFSQAGTRRVSGARSEDGTAIARGTEVAITRYERGIAYVRRWEDLAK
jgi:membrane protein implicated in regulation of membrane protease activity